MIFLDGLKLRAETVKYKIKNSKMNQFKEK